MTVKDLSSPLFGLSAEQQRAFASALQLLKKARDYALCTDVPLQQFAVSIDELCGLGLDRTDLRLLLQIGVIAPALENTRAASTGWGSGSHKHLELGPGSAFILADGPIVVFPGWQADIGDVERPAVPAAARSRARVRPVWDKQLRELRLGGVLVKHFRVPAPNQEIALDRFQKKRWIRCLKDPLGCGTGKIDTVQLHDLVTRLNNALSNHCMEFYQDGTGDGICWRGTK